MGKKMTDFFNNQYLAKWYIVFFPSKCGGYSNTFLKNFLLWNIFKHRLYQI